MAELMDVFTEGEKFICMDPNGKAIEYEVFAGEPLTRAGKHYRLAHLQEQAKKMDQEMSK